MSASRHSVAPHVAAIVPARGASRGIPHKNIVDLGGRPLLSYSVEAARACPLVSRVLVSTDDPEIASVGRKWGAETPFIRPSALARGDTSVNGAVLHAIDWLEQEDGWRVDVHVVLYPTAPFRTARLLRACILPVLEGRVTRVVAAIRRVIDRFDLVSVDGSGRLRSAFRSPRMLYQTTGSIGVVDRRREAEGVKSRLVGIEDPLSTDIDTFADLARAERMLQEGRWSAKALYGYEDISVA